MPFENFYDTARALDYAEDQRRRNRAAENAARQSALDKEWEKELAKFQKRDSDEERLAYEFFLEKVREKEPGAQIGWLPGSRKLNRNLTIRKYVTKREWLSEMIGCYFLSEFPFTKDALNGWCTAWGNLDEEWDKACTIAYGRLNLDHTASYDDYSRYKDTHPILTKWEMYFSDPEKEEREFLKNFLDSAEKYHGWKSYTPTPEPKDEFEKFKLEKSKREEEEKNRQRELESRQWFEVGKQKTWRQLFREWRVFKGRAIGIVGYRTDPRYYVRIPDMYPGREDKIRYSSILHCLPKFGRVSENYGKIECCLVWSVVALLLITFIACIKFKEGYLDLLPAGNEAVIKTFCMVIVSFLLAAVEITWIPYWIGKTIFYYTLVHNFSYYPVLKPGHGFWKERTGKIKPPKKTDLKDFLEETAPQKPTKPDAWKN